jgi:hypothetical protein
MLDRAELLVMKIRRAWEVCYLEHILEILFLLQICISLSKNLNTLDGSDENLLRLSALDSYIFSLAQ